VIAAVRGISCGGAFYLLGEADFIIATEDATFFDPHVTYQMTAAFEPVQLLQKVPLQEVLRMALLGAHERMTAQRAYEIGLVSQVVDSDLLVETASWAAEIVASSPALNVQGTLRAIWMGNEIPRSQALGLCSLYSWIGSDPEALWGAQSDFHRRGSIEWRSR
jgi:enoyl-CoA hydratase/carnithine racemase